MRRFLTTMVFLTTVVVPCWAQDLPVRALRGVLSTSQLRSTILPSNAGWQPIYSQQVEVRQGDLLRLIGQIQLTIDSAPLVGQQLRLVVDGEAVGHQAIEINSQPGSHHLPMLVSGLHLATEDGTATVTLEGSSFHSDGDFPVLVDNASNLFYGALIVEQFRSYSDLGAVWEDGALLLLDVHQPAALVQDLWCLTPYVQETLASVVFPAQAGDLLRMSGQSVAMATHGLEQFAGVLTVGERAVSPYGGQNVAPENVFAPLAFEGLDSVAEHGEQFLEFRVYGAFAHGLDLVPETTRFDVAHYSAYGHELKRFGQEQVLLTEFPANGPPVEVYSQEVDLEDGDFLQLMANLQFGKPASPAPPTVLCGLELTVEGPTGVSQTARSQKNITPIKATLPLTSGLTVRAPSAGRYRISVKASGQSETGTVPMILDGSNSQLQYLHFGRP